MKILSYNRGFPRFPLKCFKVARNSFFGARTGFQYTRSHAGLLKFGNKKKCVNKDDGRFRVRLDFAPAR